MELIVHYPKTQEKQKELYIRVAKFHADYVARYLEKLNCPMEQKFRLIDAIAETILKERDK